MLAAEALATAARLAAVGGGDGDSNPVRVVERRRVGALFAAALPACGVVGSRFGVLLGLHCLLWGAGGWRYQALHQAGGGAGWLCLGSTLPEVGGLEAGCVHCQRLGARLRGIISCCTG